MTNQMDHTHHLLRHHPSIVQTILESATCMNLISSFHSILGHILEYVEPLQVYPRYLNSCPHYCTHFS